MSYRSYSVLIVLMLLGAVLIGRLFFLQIINHGFYLALAQGQRNLSSVSTGERGSIFAQDKDGNRYLLATSRQVSFVFISPPEIPDTKEASETLGKILNLEPSAVLALIEQQKSNLYVVVKKDISEEEEKTVKVLTLSGVYIGKENRRYYPHGAFAAHVLGFVNQDGVGQYGVEGYYDKQLRGKEGIKTQITNPASYLFSIFNDTFEDGSDLVLTLDYNIQAVAESLLEKAKAQLSIEGGTILVMEAKTGAILALANTPEFNPNEYGSVTDFSVFQNQVSQATYEPGSVFKPLTMGSAMNEGKVNPQTEYEDTGSVTIADRTISNYGHKTYGRRTMTEVLEYSINTGAVFAQRQLGNKQFLSYLKKFGLFEATDIDLAGEVYSANKQLERGYDVNYATASF